MTAAGVYNFCGMQMLLSQSIYVIYGCQGSQAAGPRQEAGHDNEAEVLQKLLPLLAGAQRNLKALQDDQRKECNHRDSPSTSLHKCVSTL